MSTTAAVASTSGFTWRVRVYWEDTDAGGIVFYANYLKFFERARTEWLRWLGIEQQALRESDSVIFIVTDTRVRYLRPARLDDEIDVTAAVSETGPASLTFSQQARRHGEVLADGEIRVACVDASTLRPRRFPPSLKRILA
ncbi:MAG: tol-pal system-associated acyl-CoA thioesterase [Betaproteobacteria bacterium]|nr:tol-pal system-associated acyl-CoA thioesterase [Betaproteobacteria bacterium]